MTPPSLPVCQLRVVSTKPDVVAAYTRRHRFELGPPLTFDHNYEGISALEAFGAAFAADITNGLRARAKKRRRELSQVENVVKIWLVNPLSFLEVIGEQGNAAIQRLRLQIFVSTLEPETEMRRLLDETLACSPLYLTLTKAAEVQIDFQVAI
jgi:hypothetical protein